MSKNLKSEVFTVPNILSVFRMVLIPFIVWLYVFEEQYIEAGFVVILSGLTDALDGFIARNFDQQSDLGKVIDPIADKLTQVFILLSVMSRFPYLVIPLALFVVKEVSTGILYIIVYRRTKKVIGAKWHGKVNTILLYAVVIVHIFFYNLPTQLSILMVVAVTFTMLLSLVLYFRLYLHVLKYGGEE